MQGLDRSVQVPDRLVQVPDWLIEVPDWLVQVLDRLVQVPDSTDQEDSVLLTGTPRYLCHNKYATQRGHCVVKLF